jgi:hypothetical protein
MMNPSSLTIASAVIASEAKQSRSQQGRLDGFVASLLAMTGLAIPIKPSSSRR